MKADTYNSRQMVAHRISSGDVTRMARLAQERLGLDVDGKVGPDTIAGLWAHERTDTGTPSDQRIEPFGPFDGPLAAIPRTKRDIYDVFGNPGTPENPREGWERNLVHTKTIPGAEGHQVNVHHLVEPYMREGHRRAKLVSDYRITSIGCWNLRHIRNDPDRQLSLHSWAMAEDVNPDENEIHAFARGECPVPWSPEWMAIWPDGVDQAFVEAMESVGWVWGGVWGAAGGDFAERASHVTFCDPMHWQLRRG